MGNKHDFEKAEEEALLHTRIAAGGAYPLYWKGVDLSLRVVDKLRDEASVEDGGDLKKYAMVILILFSRSMQHAESIRKLLESGLYGDAFVLTRSIMSDLNMLIYLHYNPGLLDKFLEEKKETYQSDKEFKASFSEGVIERDLESRGMNAPGWGPGFRVLSKASHASFFGAQFFWEKDHELQKHNLKFAPYFDPEKLLLILDVMVGIHADLVSSVLWHRRQKSYNLEDEGWSAIDRDWGVLQKDVSVFCAASRKTLETLWPIKTKSSN